MRITALSLLMIVLLAWFIVFPAESIAPFQSIPPPSGLVSWWPGDGNADDIWDGNDGTLMNGATFASGKVSQAFSLDGVDDTVNIADRTNLDITEAITIDTWIKAPPVVGDSGAEIVDKGDWAYVGGAYSLRISSVYSNDLPNAGPNLAGLADLIWIGDPSTYPDNTWMINSQTRVDDDTWHFIAATYDGIAMKLYVDGILETTFSISGSIRPTDLDLRFCCNSVSGGSCFCGLIDEVEIYNRALSTSEVQAIYNAGSSGKIKNSVGGVIIPVDKFGLLAQYIGLASTVIIAGVATTICVKRAKHEKEKQ